MMNQPAAPAQDGNAAPAGQPASEPTPAPEQKPAEGGDEQAA